MHYKIIFLLITATAIYGQSFFNRVIPEELYLDDAKSMAIARSSMSTNNNSGSILSNPALLSNNREGFNININFDFKSVSERRSIVFKDEWEEALGETDYVFNQNNYFSNGIGLTYSKSLDRFKISGGIMQKPFLSLDYNYEEEIRGDSNLDDGIIGINDPIVGYQKYSTKARIDVQSIGVSFSKKSNYRKEFSFGFSLNSIVNTKLNDSVELIEIDDSNGVDNMSSISDFSNAYSIGSDDEFYSLGLQLPLSDVLVMGVSYEQDVFLGNLSNQTMYAISNIVGLPQFFGYNNEMLTYLIEDFSYKKPEKSYFGLVYTPKSYTKMMLVFETINRYWNISMPGIDKSIFEYKIGFEYSPYQSYPIRAGLVYKESAFDVIEPTSILTIGTGRKIGRFEFDVAMNYSTLKYKYFDILPLEDIYDISCEDIGCDNVTENRLNFLTTIKIGF